MADVEAESTETDAKVEEPELRASPRYFSGSNWDEEKELYVEQR